MLVHARAGERRRKSLAAAGVDVLRLSREGGRLAPHRCMGALWRRGITSVMVEGGSEVLGSFLAAKLFDEIVLFRAPLILGGRESPAFGGPNPRSLSRAARVTITNPLLAGPHEVDESFERWFPRRGSLANLARYWRSSRTLA
jgi:diaminohydroxyphosphoribosylaminopyrimidine deaminase/5-amino-6-(5-phosphoribosylamino)uracil reductase